MLFCLKILYTIFLSDDLMDFLSSALTMNLKIHSPFTIVCEI